MPCLVLPGGTDIAEVGLFSIEALPIKRGVTSEVLEELQRNSQLIRMSTGADGGYLLHAYVDEPIPPDVMRYCSHEDKLAGVFQTETGNVAFGGLESAFGGFKSNPAIRNDGAVPSSRYTYAGYHTDFPDELVSADIDSGLSKNERRFLATPAPVGIVAFFAVVVAMASQLFLIAAILVVTSVVAIRAIVRSTNYRDLTKRRTERALKYPSIVIELRSNNHSVDGGAG
jgi:hypothetical protein